MHFNLKRCSNKQKYYPKDHLETQQREKMYFRGRLHLIPCS